MSYTPYRWKNGDTITANRMNHLENGVFNVSNEDEVVVIHVTAKWDNSKKKYVNINSDKSASEVIELVKAGTEVVAQVQEVGSSFKRWLSLIKSSYTSATFSSQEVHYESNLDYSTDVYTLEFTHTT